MKITGSMLILIGVLGAIVGLFLYDPTVATSSPYGLPDRVANLQGLTIQLTIILVSGFSFLGGSVFYVAGELLERLSAPGSFVAETPAVADPLAFENQF